MNFVENLGSSSHVSFEMTLKRDRQYKEQVIEKISTMCGIKKRRAIDFNSFEFTNNQNHIVMDIPAIGSSPCYWFRFPEKIVPQCASSWTNQKLLQLCIKFIDAESIAQLLGESSCFVDAEVSEKGKQLQEELKPLTTKMMEEFRTSSSLSLDELARNDALVKTVFVVGKYRNVEAVVDLFVCFLLQRLGYFNDRLFAFPQFPHSILFGTEKCDAIPDFTIMDVLSFYRAFVFEEKSDASSSADSNVEAQLIAEAIAVFQSSFPEIANNPTSALKDVVGITVEGVESTSTSSRTLSSYEKNNVILGVKVKGTIFTFYAVPITIHILTALKNCRASSETTTVTRLGSLDFKVEEQRNQIITVLDIYKQMIAVLGEKSSRRPSGTNNQKFMRHIT